MTGTNGLECRTNGGCCEAGILPPKGRMEKQSGESQLEFPLFRMQTEMEKLFVDNRNTKDQSSQFKDLLTRAVNGKEGAIGVGHQPQHLSASQDVHIQPLLTERGKASRGHSQICENKQTRAKTDYSSFWRPVLILHNQPLQGGLRGIDLIVKQTAGLSLRCFSRS